MERIDTCNTVWLLDPALMQFCRMPKGSDLSNAVSAPWQAYFAWDEEPETGAFRVALDEARTRWLTSWRHVDPCPRCSGEPTKEVIMPPPPQVSAGNGGEPPA
jgi:hypothetical protein